MADQDRTKGQGEEGESRPMTVALIQAVNHPLRRQLLRALNSSDDARSPIQLTELVNEDVGNIAYHIKVLASLGAVKKTGERQIRGARENFFASRVSDHARVIAILADTEAEDDGLRR